MSVTITVTGSFKSTQAFLDHVHSLNIQSILESYGQMGVEALSTATPEETGAAAHSWGYTVSHSRGMYELAWTNSDVENGFPVVVMLQMGHGTGTGGYVQGRDFINPAIRPVFDKIADIVWKAVTLT
jgi:hypothetical protein